MSNLEKFYSSFGGVDTRSNKLLMNKNTFRNGSKNFRYNYQDEIQKANGLQHKTQANPVEFVDIFEYKFTDLITGAEKTELLAVGVDGNLYRKKEAVLKWLTHGVFESYSIYYDEVTDDFCLTLNPAGPSVHFNTTKTGLQLKADLNAIAGVSVEFETTIPAYLLDCSIENKFQDNPVFFWEVVPHPNIRSTTGTNGTLSSYQILQTPFETTVKAQTDPVVKAAYEGIASQNLNNSIYICDGGFVYKYDGKCVYRAGMPRTQHPQAFPVDVNNFGKNGIKSVWSAFPGAGSIPFGAYFYKFRYGFTDANGMVTYGEIRELSDYSYGAPTPPAPPTQGATLIENVGFKYGKDFPVFAAKVVGNQGNLDGASLVLTVASGHNILPGMVIRQITNTGGTVPATRNTYNSKISFYAKVTAVTQTTLTLQSVACNSGENLFSSVFLDGDIVNGYFTQSEFEGRLYDPTTSPAGAFLQIFRTKRYDETTIDDGTAKAAGPYYHVYDMPMPIQNADTAKILDGMPDEVDPASNRYVSLRELLDDAGEGFELPRAGKFITTWQDLLVQLGRTADTTIKDRFYPSNFLLSESSAYCQTPFDTTSRYTEALLCDNQSVYWNDPNAPEGFAQDGLHEFKIATKDNGSIRAAIENKDALIAIKDKTTSIISGDVGQNTLSMETLEDDVGIQSFKTLKEVNGAAIWMDPVKGFFSLVAGRLPVAIGWNISDYQQNNYQKLDFSKATASVFKDENLYICAVGSTLFVFDYARTGPEKNRNCWYIWERFPIKSLVGTGDGKFFFLTDRVWQMKTTNTKYDFTDHTAAIEMRAPTAWLNWGDPTVDKNFERIWVNSIQGGFDLTIEQYGNYLDELIGQETITMVPGTTKKTVKEYIKCIVSKLSGFSFALVNNEKNKFVRIQGFEVEYSPIYTKTEPRK